MVTDKQKLKNGDTIRTKDGQLSVVFLLVGTEMAITKDGKIHLISDLEPVSEDRGKQ